MLKLLERKNSSSNSMFHWCLTPVDVEIAGEKRQQQQQCVSLMFNSCKCWNYWREREREREREKNSSNNSMFHWCLTPVNVEITGERERERNQQQQQYVSMMLTPVNVEIIGERKQQQQQQYSRWHHINQCIWYSSMVSIFLESADERQLGRLPRREVSNRNGTPTNTGKIFRSTL